MIYDPSAGFVTGGGWINSPAGAYAADPAADRQGQLRLRGQVQEGRNVPDGNTNFQFQAGNLHFESSSYDWLVIAGQDKAKYKGTGTINGNGAYKFMLTAVDNGRQRRHVHIKIWDDNGVVYDNDASSATMPTAAPSWRRQHQDPQEVALALGRA